ncbi:MAG: hypothetical protein ACLP7Q_25830, partial [Isosphaeraceae bacterium]
GATNRPRARRHAARSWCHAAHVNLQMPALQDVAAVYCRRSVKGNTTTSVHDLETTEPVEWLGFRIGKGGTGVAVFPAERSWNGLRDGLEQAHTKPDSPIRAIETIEGWVGQMGPCRPYLDIPAFFARIATLATGLAIDELPSLERIVELLDDAHGRWDHIRKRAHVPELG